MFKYSLPSLIKAYNDNRELIIAYQSGQSVEGFTDSNISSSEGDTVLGMTIGLFIAVLVISLALWIWGLVLMIVYWKVLADWAKAVGIVGLVIGFPLLTIIVGYLGRK